MGSEMERKRRLIAFVFQNLRLDGSNLLFDAVKPYDMLLRFNNRSDWSPLVDMFVERRIELGFTSSSLEARLRGLELAVS